MKYYKSPTNEIFAYELDGSQDHLIPANFIQLTQEEIDAREKQFYEQKVELEKKLQEQKAAKESALAKLTALGLTQDEIKALVG